MPAGTPPEAVREATADAARELFDGHKYVFVLHEDQGAPHVHLSVRADRYDGVRLSPRKADLDRWRAVFARDLQDRGVNAVATRQPVRAVNRNYRKLWEERAAGRAALTRQRPAQRTSAKALAARAEAIKAWEQIARALASSKDSAVVRLSVDADRYLAEVAPGGLQAARVAAQRAQQQCVEGRAGSLKIAATLKPASPRSVEHFKQPIPVWLPDLGASRLVTSTASSTPLQALQRVGRALMCGPSRSRSTTC